MRLKYNEFGEIYLMSVRGNDKGVRGGGEE